MIEKIKHIAEAQKKQKTNLCPRCGSKKLESDLYMNALSRRADVFICSDCGIGEALCDAFGYCDGIETWYVFQEK